MPLLPQMLRVNCDTAQEYYLQQTIKDKLQGYVFSYNKSASAILVNLSQDLSKLRDELASSSGGLYLNVSYLFKPVLAGINYNSYMNA